LIFGRLTASDYEDAIAADPRIDALRYRTTVEIDPRFTEIFRDPAVRGNPAAIELQLQDGNRTPRVEVLYPLGHRRRRDEGIPRLLQKFEANLARCFAPKRVRQIMDLCTDVERLDHTAVDVFMDLLAA
jgi:2-methylcitrate dehydratase